MIDINQDLAIENCSKHTPCVKTEYPLKKIASSSDVQKCSHTGNSNLDTCLILSFGHNIVESIVTTASYDSQSLIGEIGGTLGLFLGLSGLSILEIMILISSNDLWKKYSQRVLVVAFFIIFFYYGIVAFLKFWEEPKAMQISIKKENLKAEFPYVTFCNEPDEGLYFYQFIEEQLTKNTTWDHFNDDNGFLANIIDPYVKSNGHVIYLKSQEVVSSVYHRKYGLCYTLDIRKQEDLKIESGPVTLGFQSQLSYGNPGFRWIFLHDFEDLPNVEEPSISLKGFRSKFYVIRKTKYSSISTQNKPCNEDITSFQVCKDIEMHEHFRKQHQCQIPFLLSWTHASYNGSLPVCNNSVTLMAFQTPTDFVTACKSMLPCEYSRYNLRSKEDKVDEVHNDVTSLKTREITLDDTLELHESFIGYDAISFLGEAGGTLGMCLGWSLLFFVELLLDYAVQDSKLHIKLTRFSIFSLLMIFLYWSSSTMIDYYEQSESMELDLETMTYPPHITVCNKKNYCVNQDTVVQCKLKYRFMEWLNQMYPCSKNQPDYKSAVIACLQSNHIDILETIRQYSTNKTQLLPPTTVLSSKSDDLIINKEFWKSIFHDKYGECWMLDSKYWHRYCISAGSPLY